MMRCLLLVFLTVSVALSRPALAVGSELSEIQTDWAIANYQLKGAAREKAFEKLLAVTTTAVQAHPLSAELWIWDGIVKSSFAGVKGGLGGLSYAKQSREALEHAIELDGSALQGSAYTSLGVLYYKVPGWPLGFGSDKKAKQLLTRALEINPKGIDPNYFYGDFLIESGDFIEAEKYLQKARAAAPRPDRPLADSGRQREISTALAVVEKRKK